MLSKNVSMFWRILQAQQLLPDGQLPIGANTASQPPVKSAGKGDGAKAQNEEINDPPAEQRSKQESLQERGEEGIGKAGERRALTISMIHMLSFPQFSMMLNFYDFANVAQ